MKDLFAGEIDPFEEMFGPAPVKDLSEIGGGRITGGAEHFHEPVKPPSPKFSKADHNLRSQKHWQDKGYECFRVDQTVTTWDGQVFKLDFLGLFDWMATKPGEPDVGIQVCATSDIENHITGTRGLCSKAVTSFNKKQKIENLVMWLTTGHRAVILGWQQPGGKGTKWVETEHEITMEYVEKLLAKRAKRGRK